MFTAAFLACMFSWDLDRFWDLGEMMRPILGTLNVRGLGTRLAGRWDSGCGGLTHGNGLFAKASK